jgi:hypothetical protein
MPAKESFCLCALKDSNVPHTCHQCIAQRKSASSQNYENFALQRMAAVSAQQKNLQQSLWFGTGFVAS